MWVVGLKLLADAHSQAQAQDVAATPGASIPLQELHRLQYWANVSKGVYEDDAKAFVSYLRKHQRVDAPSSTATGALGHSEGAEAGAADGKSVLRGVGSAVKGALANVRLAADMVIAKRAGRQDDSGEHKHVTTDDVLSGVWQSRPAQPAHVVYVDHTQRAIVLAVRGTHSVHDALTDMGLDAVPFMESYAHRGIAESARWLVERTAPVLAAAVLSHPGYHVVVTGHSLGAGVAVLASLLLRGTRRRDARAALDEYEGEACVVVRWGLWHAYACVWRGWATLA